MTGPRARTRPAWTKSPSSTSTGTDSPVNGALFKAPRPSTIRPSAGTSSPLRTSMRSPTERRSMGTCSGSESACPPAGAIGSDIEDAPPIWMAEGVNDFLSGTRRATRGNRSSPPCIASLAFINASPSRCAVSATRMATMRASSHIIKPQAPMTARLVRTWKPSWRLTTRAIASLNI